MAGRIIKNGGYILRSLLTTKGDMVVRGDYGPERLASGADGDVLKGVGAGNKPVWYSSSELLKINLVDSIFNNEVGALVTQTSSGYNVGKVPNGSAGQYLKCNGAGNIPSWDVPSIEKPIGTIWSPATGSSNPDATTEIKGAFPVMIFDNAVSAHVSITVPDDFSSIYSVYLFGISGDTCTRELKIETNYGCNNENYFNHSQIIFSTIAFSSDKIFSTNLAPALTSIAANDQIGIKVLFNNDFAYNTGIIGVKFAYNRS